MNSSLHLTNCSTPRRSARKVSRSASTRLASALLLLGGLTSTAFAQATWVGGTSQDWNTGANWSVNPPSGAITINTATGSYPIFTGPQAFTVADTFVGSGTGNSGRFDINSGTFSTGTGRLRIGDGGGAGTVNIAAGATVTTAEASLGQGTAGGGTSTLNVSGTLSATGQVRVSNGSNNVINSVGVLNVLDGGVVNSEGDLIVAFAGSDAASGTVNIEAGGIVNVASTVERWLIINQWDPLHGHLNVNGGTLNINANTDIRFNTGNNASVGSSSLTLNSGAINGGASSVLDLNRSANATAVNNTINLNGGTLTISQIISNVNNGTRTLNFNGGTVRATATTADFIPATAASIANVKAGGAIFDSNGFDITVAETLVADTVSTGGGLTKLGAGALTLAAANTYTGNTAVNGGTLVLADNASLKFVVGANGVSTQITGTGALTLNGDFVLDLAAAGTTVGNSWQLVDAGLTTTYGATFTFGDFAPTADKWLKQANGVYYQFDPATGVLSVINNPTVPAPTVTAKPSRDSYATGSDIQLGVTASGVGTLTYQWYFQATGAPSPVLIDGATSANYIITGASASSEGVYSVVVTDSAANTPTTITFPTFTVRPGTDFSVAYYRLEGDIADSIGSNDFTLLGSATFDPSVPVPTISRTDAPNTASISFPATGNNGLVAATNSTLATTALEDFTIEAFVRFDALPGFQTIVGRDDDSALATDGQGAGGQALFYLSKSDGAVGGGVANGFRVELITKDNVNLQVNSTKAAVVGTWYHVAAVGDATKGTLTLYVDGIAVGTTTGYNGLFVPTTGSDTPWTIGRGDFNVADVDFLRGDLDEVRFSSTALPPSQFLIGSDQGLIVPPPITDAPASRTVAAGATTTLEVVVTGDANYEWYKDDVLLPGQNSATLVLSNVSAANEGVYRVKAINIIDAGVFSSATATVRVLSVPSAGRRTIGLNFVGAGSGSWSDVIYAFGESEAAGFYSSTNWNNSAAASNVFNQTTPLLLEESTGLNPAGTSATWSSANTWSARIETGDPADKSEHGKLIHGYIESRAATGSTVTLNNIPYASYDVYVYVSGGNGGDRVGSVSIDREGSATYLFRPFQNDTTRPVVTPEAPYAPYPMIGEAATIEEARAAAPATFVRYTGVTGSDLTITAKDATLNQNAGGIAAVQIVDTTPVGSAYPPIVTTAPTPKLVKAGASASFSVAAIPGNAGGTLSYTWTKEGSATVLGTSSTLTLSGLTSADTGRYIVTITEASSLGASNTTRPADLVVVDSARSVLINGDINAGGSPTYVGDGVLRADGSRSVADLEAVATSWNGINGAAGSGSGTLAKESTGLGISGVTFSFSGASGAESNTTQGNIANTVAEELEQDYLYVDAGSAPLTATVGGLQDFAGHQVTLLVYAIGKTTKTHEAVTTAPVNDTAVVSLASVNNHLAASPVTTTVVGVGNSADAGRNIEFNSPEAPTNGGISSGYAVFTGVVDGDGRVSWTVGPDSSEGGGGLAPLVGFQLLVTGTNLAPAAPTGLQAVAGNNQVSLSWNAVSGAETYTVKRSDTPGGPYTNLSLGAIVSPSYTDNSALNGNTYYYVVAAANSVAQGEHSAEVSATLGSTATALETWRQTHFGSTANSGEGADSADPDADGIANLLEYAFDTLPKTSNASPVVVARNGSGFLTLSFPHRADSTLRYHVDSSNDLGAAWTLDEPGLGFASAGTHTHTDNVSLSTQPRRFLRLRVTTTP